MINDIFKDIAQTLDDAVIDEVYKKEKHLVDEDGDSSTDNQDSHNTRPAFKFSMVGLKPGDEIIFDPTGIKVTKVRRILSISRSAYRWHHRRITFSRGSS